jgi:hypothetical protein
MGDSNETTRNVLQFGLFLGLLLVGIMPFILMVWRSGSFRERMMSFLGCADLRECCTRRVHYDAADLRTLQELEEPPERQSVGINGAYRMYQIRRSRLSLRLASWREDIQKCGRQDDLHHKLSQIQAAQYPHQPAVATYARTATPAPAPAARAPAQTTAVPFDIQIVSINNRVDESTNSSAASSSIDDDEPVYTLVPPTPTSSASASSSASRRPLTDEEEEEKEEPRV